MNLNRLTMGGRVVAVAGMLLFIDSLLPWFRLCASDLIGISVPGISNTCVSQTAWSNWASLLAVLVTIAMLVQIGLELASVQLPTPGTFSWAQVQLAAAALVLLLVVIQIAVGDSPGRRYLGAWLGLVFAAGLLYGAVLRSRESAAPPQWTPPREPTTP